MPVGVEDGEGGGASRPVSPATDPPAGPLMVHITDLLNRDGLGLVRCERCRKGVDANEASVGTVVDGSLSSSVLLCPECGQAPQIRGWLVDYLDEAAGRTSDGDGLLDHRGDR